MLFLYPLALIAHAALIDDSGALNLAAAFEVLNSRAFLNALLNTAEIAVASTAGCVILGLTLGLILAFAPFPGAGLVARVIDTFIALPTFLVTLAFTFLYGSAGILNGALAASLGLDHPPVDFLYSAWGVILAEVTVYTPVRPAPAARRLLARRSQPDRGREPAWRAPVADRAPGDPARRAAGDRRRRQSLPAA